MNAELLNHFKEHIALAQRVSLELTPKIGEVGTLLCRTFERGNKVLTFGNGGAHRMRCILRRR